MRDGLVRRVIHRPILAYQGRLEEVEIVGSVKNRGCYEAWLEEGGLRLDDP
jgi:hypothetical protein